MPFRITDASINDRLVSNIAQQRNRISVAQEQISSGKRINRPSDDPVGAAAVIEIRASQASLEQFRRNARVVDTALSVSDGALDSYERMLDKARALITQGSSDLTREEGRKAIASELDGLRQSIMNVANTQSEGQYIFGGTEQENAPVDPTTVTLIVSSAPPRVIQIEPNAPPVIAGVTANAVFANSDGTIFEMLSAAAAALRGTGDPAADQAALGAALDQLSDFGDQASVARTTLGKSLNSVEIARDRLDRDSLSMEETAQAIESADFAKSSVELLEAERALEATLQAGGQRGRRSLLDFLG